MIKEIKIFAKTCSADLTHNEMKEEEEEEKLVKGTFLKQKQHRNERKLPSFVTLYSSPQDAIYNDILIEFFVTLPKPQLMGRCKLVSKH